MKVLSDLPEQVSDRLVVGGGPDDAGVYELEDDRLMIQSVDFFTPIVDDPNDYGRIAAANSMSDVFAMGGQPRTALNITGVPLEDVGIDRLNKILTASQEAVSEAGAVVLGGHTVKAPEPVFGLAVTGFVDNSQLIQNNQATVGDYLILTKPLGTGILTTAHKQQAIPENTWLREGINWMARLNSIGVTLADNNLVSSMTDITGYGFLGHCFEMLGDQLGAKIHFSDVPVLDGVRQLAEAGFVPGGTKSNWDSVEDRTELQLTDELGKWILADAQTSGGLLLAVDESDIEDVTRLLKKDDHFHQTIGRVTDEPGVVVTS